MNYKDIDPDKIYPMKDIWNYVWERDGGYCQLCGKVGMCEHHILYKSRGGKDKPNNLILFCMQCHEHVHRVNCDVNYLFNKIRINELRLRQRLI